MTRFAILIACIALFASCTKKGSKQITLFYTTDEHGWLADNETADGAASLLQIWKEREGYNEADSFLVVSGGDMWTGASVSTWFNGRSMVEVMNHMGYDVAALGNHEFDYTVDTLLQRISNLDFPIIAANISVKETGKQPDFIKPYIIKEANGVKVAMIGLASMSTPVTANPNYVAPYDFTDYEAAIRKTVPKVKAEGAELIIVVGHICEQEMESISATAKEFGIPLITGGHCHTAVMKKHNDVLLIETEAYMKTYIKVVLDYNLDTKTASVSSFEKVENKSEETDMELQQIVDDWSAKADKELNKTIGYTGKTIERESKTMHQMVVNSWLEIFPDADVAITNDGGIRQDIPEGNITLGTIVGLLPFNNHIIKLEFTGEELKKAAPKYITGGMNADFTKFDDGRILDPKETYTILTTDYLYSVKQNGFSEFDDTMEDTYVIYREPTIEWIRSLKTSTKKPFEKYLN